MTRISIIFGSTMGLLGFKRLVFKAHKELRELRDQLRLLIQRRPVLHNHGRAAIHRMWRWVLQQIEFVFLQGQQESGKVEEKVRAFSEVAVNGIWKYPPVRRL